MAKGWTPKSDCYSDCMQAHVPVEYRGERRAVGLAEGLYIPDVHSCLVQVEGENLALKGAHITGQKNQ